jgi:hypothetical protein
MNVHVGDTVTAETVRLAAYQGQVRARPVIGSARMAVLGARIVDLWPATIIALALGLSLAWTGLLMSLMWWGIERLI